MTINTITFPETAQSVGERIKYLRSEKGLSREQLAAKIGVSHRTIAHYEQGTTSPTIAMLYKIANWLQVAPQIIAFGSGKDTSGDGKSVHQLDENGKLAVEALARLTVMRIQGFSKENQSESLSHIGAFTDVRDNLDIPDFISLAVGRDVKYLDILEEENEGDQVKIFTRRLFDKAIIGTELDLMAHDQIVDLAESLDIQVPHFPFCLDWSSYDVPSIAETIRDEVYQHRLGGGELVAVSPDQSDET